MRAIEIVARALATAHAQGRFGRDPNDQDYHPTRRYAELNWPDHELQAKRLLRLLAHRAPARVAKLRALGNAIDLRPAAQFIAAAAGATEQLTAYQRPEGER